MTTAKSNYLENELLEHIFKGTAIFTPPSNLYVSLHTTNPGEDGSGTEVSGNNYARVEVAADSGWTKSGNEVTNASAVTFPEASGSWGTVTHFAIWDASSGGNMLYYEALDASRSVSSGETPEFEAGELAVEED